MADNLILGVDPGGRHTGFGLIQVGPGETLLLVAQGCFSPDQTWPYPRRLAYIYYGLDELILNYRPGAVAVEGLFVGQNIRSVLSLAQVRGVVLLAAAKGGAKVFEYAPRLVKNTVVGYGQAEKKQVARMVTELLHLTEVLAADAADALAVAICHAAQMRLSRRLPGLSSRHLRRVGWRNLTTEDLATLNYDPDKK
ncbi:MAG: crossover junction endodeoxyribonuclease RuvC [Candidatus Adiutrix intracellularis]|nr:crossover junction endodeoxyribonuclease RuvC [Candidatus Adiutrix intracellularis]